MDHEFNNGKAEQQEVNMRNNHKLMHTILTIAVIIIVLFSLTACDSTKVLQGLMPKQDDNSDSVAVASEKKIMTAINTKNSLSIKNMFSKNAILKISDFDQSLKSFEDFYKGKYISDQSGNSTEYHMDDGKQQIKINCTMTVKTSVDTYVISFYQIIRDDNDSNNIGIYQLDIIRAANAESSTKWHNPDIPQDYGIHCFS